MEITIKPDEIDEYVKNAIIKSSIGKIINDNAKKYMEEYICRSYDSPIKTILTQVVKDLLENEMKKPENTSIIIEEFNKQFNEEIIRKIIYKTIDNFRLNFSDT